MPEEETIETTCGDELPQNQDDAVDELHIEGNENDQNVFNANLFSPDE
jgi:hypothetical protein